MYKTQRTLCLCGEIIPQPMKPALRAAGSINIFTPALSEQLVQRDRQIAHTLGSCVKNRIGDCRRRARDADFADSWKLVENQNAFLLWPAFSYFSASDCALHINHTMSYCFFGGSKWNNPSCCARDRRLATPQWSVILPLRTRMTSTVSK